MYLLEGLVSVIVPIYNAEKYITRCIESILQQTYKNIQLILINDGSTDNSLKICNHYKTLDKRIIVIDKENEGVSATRNYGISVAEGDYIGFVDSDDHIEEGMYETLVKRIKDDNSEVAALTAYTINSVDNNKLLLRNNSINSSTALDYLLKLAFPTSLWAYLYKKAIIQDTRLNEELHFFEDFEFNLRILTKAKKISLCSDKFYNYITNEGSINSQRINDKKVTSLDIYDYVYNLFSNEKSKRRLQYASFFRAHFLISIILSLSKSYVDAEEKYFRIVHENARKIITDIIISKHVPKKYKIIILMCAANTRLTIRLIYLLRYKK